MTKKLFENIVLTEKEKECSIPSCSTTDILKGEVFIDRVEKDFKEYFGIEVDSSISVDTCTKNLSDYDFFKKILEFFNKTYSYRGTLGVPKFQPFYEKVFLSRLNVFDRISMVIYFLKVNGNLLEPFLFIDIEKIIYLAFKELGSNDEYYNNLYYLSGLENNSNESEENNSSDEDFDWVREAEDALLRVDHDSDININYKDLLDTIMTAYINNSGVQECLKLLIDKGFGIDVLRELKFSDKDIVDALILAKKVGKE
jgi:hypothetical protein